MFPFYTPWKHQKTFGFSGVFRSYAMGTWVTNWPRPLHKEEGVDFFKIDGNGDLNIFPRKGGVLEMGGVAYYSEVFLEIPHDVA